jgi:hypothetical protein
MHGRDKKEEHAEGEKNVEWVKQFLNQVNRWSKAPHSLNQKCQKQVATEISEDYIVL